MGSGSSKTQEVAEQSAAPVDDGIDNYDELYLDQKEEALGERNWQYLVQLCAVPILLRT